MLQKLIQFSSKEKSKAYLISRVSEPRQFLFYHVGQRRAMHHPPGPGQPARRPGRARQPHAVRRRTRPQRKAYCLSFIMYANSRPRV